MYSLSELLIIGVRADWAGQGCAEKCATNLSAQALVFYNVVASCDQLNPENKELSRRIVQIERHLADHDEQIIELVKAIKQLLKPDPPPKKRRIGFHAEKH